MQRLAFPLHLQKTLEETGRECKFEIAYVGNAKHSYHSATVQTTPLPCYEVGQVLQRIKHNTG